MNLPQDFKTLFALGLVVVFFFFSNAVMGDEVTRTIEKKYTLAPEDVLEIKNQYGEIDVHTWNKPTTEVKITIRSKAASERKANERLDDVTVRERSLGNNVQLETRLPRNNWFLATTSQGLHVDYEIHLPAANAIHIDNKFGDVYLEDRAGNVRVTMKYGELVAEDLMGRGNYFKLEFGKADIFAIAGGDFDLSFGNLDIEEAGELFLKSNASNIKIEKVGWLDLDVNLGEIQVAEADSVTGSHSAAKFELGDLYQKLDLNVKFASHFEVEQVGPDFRSINLEGDFSSFRIGFDTDTRFDLDAHLNHGKLDAENLGMTIYTSQEEDDKYLHYETRPDKTARSANPAPKVQVRSKYGSVKLVRY